MYDRTPYTPNLREVLKLSNVAARELGHAYIAPEHLLLGILALNDRGLAVQTLCKMQIDLQALKGELLGELEKGEPLSPSTMFARTQPALETLEVAREAARELRHNWVGTEHLLLGLVKMEQTIPGKCLAKHGMHYDNTREAVNEVVNSPPPFSA